MESQGQSPTRDPRRPWAPSEFTRLARAHAASVSGDALFAIGLAGSVFFSLDFTAARTKVALYLVLTIAPFAIAAPLIGPMLDRIKGGRRWIIIGSLALRAVLAYFVVRHMATLWFYPEAFGMLVLQKVYAISKSAVIPGTVHSDEELVEANSKLTVLSALAVVAAAVPGGLLLKLGGGQWAVGAGGLVFLVGTVLALRMQPTSVASGAADEVERSELRGAGIVHAANAMGLMRGIVGFLSFMLAFDFKNNGLPLWQLGIVAAAAQIGFFFGAIAAPRARRMLTEERIIIGCLLLTSGFGVLTAFIGGLGGAALLSFAVGVTASAAKQAFDSIVQRDAPDANRGRSFAKFETRFQLTWVIGALLPIVLSIESELGFAIIAVTAAVAVIMYLLGMRNLRRGRLPTQRRIRVGRRGIEIISTAERVPDRGFAAPTDDDGEAYGPHPGDDSPMGRFLDRMVDARDDDPTLGGARRWMRGPSPDARPAPRAPDLPPKPRADDHRSGGLLFDSEAWNDPPMDDGPDDPPFSLPTER